MKYKMKRREKEERRREEKKGMMKEEKRKRKNENIRSEEERIEESGRKGMGRKHCKNWGVKMTPVGVNRGPHPQVLKLHPRV